VVVAIQAVNDLAPVAGGRQWTAEQYRVRDAVLSALGVSAFGRQRAAPQRRE
jgi:hypothetical protein